MHELAASILLVVDLDSFSHDAASSSQQDLVGLTLSREFVEYDTWTLYESVMKHAKGWYQWREEEASAPGGGGAKIGIRRVSFFLLLSRGEKTQVIGEADAFSPLCSCWDSTSAIMRETDKRRDASLTPGLPHLSSLFVRSGSRETRTTYRRDLQPHAWNTPSKPGPSTLGEDGGTSDRAADLWDVSSNDSRHVSFPFFVFESRLGLKLT